MPSWAFVKEAHTMINSMAIKPMIRRTYSCKKSFANTLRSTLKVGTEKVWNINKNQIGSELNNNCWVPHERTGIYYPKGQEKVMEGIPPGAGKDVKVVNFFSHHEED